ncbi:MAG: anaerobic ribonucleoside-triphosphate reductase activating protein [Oscillospiraceae bacterium]|nr:anaerobic ribonucleoside-triphosphate reductase activating protein [Oscillospiraceae bacterium]
MTLRINARINETIADGPGFRYAIYTQGCLHNCEGCHNPEALTPDGGYDIDLAVILAEIDGNPLLDGITLSGGEPFLQIEPLVDLCRIVRAKGLNIWAFSGWTFEELYADEHKRQLLELCDVVIDGRFMLAERTLTLPWRGSENQRVIDVPASLRDGVAVTL